MKGIKRVSALIVCLLLLSAVVSFAHEGESHGKQHADAKMAKLHKMMPEYAKSQARLNAALEKGDVAAITKETGYLLSTATDLKKAKPHKHLKDLKAFQKIAAEFETDVKSTADLARKGDLNGAKASFASVQKGCTDCHAKFRD